jgi:hypothetical protein
MNIKLGDKPSQGYTNYKLLFQITKKQTITPYINVASPILIITSKYHNNSN